MWLPVLFLIKRREDRSKVVAYFERFYHNKVSKMEIKTKFEYNEIAYFVTEGKMWMGRVDIIDVKIVHDPHMKGLIPPHKRVGVRVKYQMQKFPGLVLKEDQLHKRLEDIPLNQSSAI